MAETSKKRARKSKIEIRNYGDAIDEEILRLQKISSSIDATMAKSVISESHKATDNKNIKMKTAVKRKTTLQSKKRSNPTHTENVIALQDDDIIEPQFKISKIVGNYSTYDENNIDKSIPVPTPLQFSIKVEVEEFVEDFCIQNVGHSPKNSNISKDIVNSDLESKSYKSTSASCRNINEPSEIIDESVGSAAITDKSNSKDDITATDNKLIIPSKPIIIKLPTKHAVNKVPLKPEIVKLKHPVKTKAQSLLKLVEMTTNDTEQLLKSIDNLDKDTDNSSKTITEPLVSISKSLTVPSDSAEAIFVDNNKPVACRDLHNNPAEPILDENERHFACKDFLDDAIKSILDKNEKHVTYRDTYVFEIDYVLETAEKLFRSFTDPADKKLENDFRSYWCRPQVIFEETLTERKLQDSIKKWRYWQNMCTPRESPVSYKCYICMKAWWHLSDFREHLRTHNERDLKLDIEKNSFECSIISYLGYMPEQEDIYIEGKCWKCRYGFEEHTLEKRYYDSLYTCSKCNEKFYTCTAMRHHEERCEKYRENCLLVEKTEMFSYECEQCSATFVNKESLYDHQIHCHCVRSDIPAVTYAKPCNACKALFACFNCHTCPKKLEIAMCKYCGKSFSNPFLASVHMNLAKSNVKCDFCERVMTKECLMMEHLIMEHSANFMLVYRCRICPKPVLMRTPLAITRHRKKCHSKVKCNVTMIVPIPKECLSDLEAPNDSSLDECKQDEDIEIITDTVKEQVIEIIDSDDEDETIDIKTELFEAEENELQIDENSINSNDGDENAMIYNEQRHSTDNFNIANKLTYNHDIKVKLEIVDDEYGKQLHTNIKETPEECDQERDGKDLKIINEENEYENLLSKVFQASKFVNASSLLDDNVGVTDKQKAMVTQMKTEDLISLIKAEPVDEDYQDDLIILKADHFNETKLIADLKLENNPEIKIEEPDVKPAITIESGRTYKCKCEFTGTKQEIDAHNRKSKCFRKRHRLYRCKKCDFIGRHKQFVDHTANVCNFVNEMATIHCTKCETSFADLKMYAYHFKHHGVPVAACPVCLEKFDLFATLERHIQGHIKSLYVRFQVINNDPSTAASEKNCDKIFKCQKCQALVVKDQFFEHWESHLNIITERKDVDVVEQESNKCAETADDDGTYVSLDAGMLQTALSNLVATNPNTLRPSTASSETQKVAPVRGTRNTCCVCSRKFHRYNDSKRHLIEHLLADAYVEKINSGNTSFRCQICDATHQKIDKYKLHMREHASLPIYRCELCNKSFSDSSNFTKHKKVHNLKVVICSICDKKFQMKASLEKHMIRVHLTSDTIKCAQCPAIFYENSTYKKHIRSKHERAKYISKCHICGIKFERLKYKWDHMWEKHKQRKFDADCPLCDMTYRKFSDVKRHISTDHHMSLSMNAITKMNMNKGDMKKYKIVLQE